MLRLAGGMVVALTLTGTAPLADIAQDIAPVSRDIAYRTIGGTPLLLDVYRPATDRIVPVVIHMHGGGWSRGARPERGSGFRPWIDSGHAVVTIQYRLAGEARAPAAVQDVRCAMAWVARHADKLRIDPDRIILTGTSAGGHLALVAGMLKPGNAIDTPDCGAVPAAMAIVSHSGPSDLRPRPEVTRESISIAGWVGTGPDAAALRVAMSPVVQAHADMPPVFQVHGDADPVVPVMSAHQLKARLDELGVANGLYLVPGGGHGGFSPQHQSAASRAMLAFLAGQTGSAPKR